MFWATLAKYRIFGPKISLLKVVRRKLSQEIVKERKTFGLRVKYRLKETTFMLKVNFNNLVNAYIYGCGKENELIEVHNSLGRGGNVPVLNKYN